MNHTKGAIILMLIIILLSSNASGFEKAFFVQDTSIVKQVKKAPKKISFLKKLFQHDDSTKRVTKFIHEHHKLLKEKNLETFKSDIEGVDIEAAFFKTKEGFKLDYEVFGWYPYWEKDYYKHLNYSLLSTVAYFSYEVDPRTGNPKTVYDWETTPLIDSIQAYKNKKALLTISNFGEKNNRRFLKNVTAINKLIENLKLMLANRKANGICVDFEGVNKRDKDNYTSFLLTLNNELKKANKSYQVYLAVPAVDWRASIDFPALIPAIDKFVVMGYDYYGKTSSVAGPIAPLKSGSTWVSYNLETSIKYYLENKVPKEKMIVALPAYGSIWETKNQNIASKAKRFIGSRTYSYIKSKILEPTYIEPASKSAYTTYRINDKHKTIRQCWYENDTSFAIKTRYIKNQKLAGVGLWALGYDKGYNDLWKVIDNELGNSPAIKDSTNIATTGTGNNETTNTSEDTSSNNENTSNSTDNASNTTTANNGVVDKVVTKLGMDDPNSKINQLEKRLIKITDYKTILLYVLAFALFFACIGFVIAMLSPNTRMQFFSDAMMKIYYMAFILLLAMVLLRKLEYINDNAVILSAGFILGGLAFYIASKILERKKRNMP